MKTRFKTYFISPVLRAGALTVLAFMLLIPPLSAQFIRVQLELDDEMTVRSGQNLNFGSIPINFGWVNVDMGDELAGRTTIRTMENITIQVTVIAPEELVLNERNVMPFTLQASYYNSIPDRNPNPVMFEGNSAIFPVNDGGKLIEYMDRRRERLEANLYFYGSVYAGRIDPGVYRGEVIVRIEYE